MTTPAPARTGPLAHVKVLDLTRMFPGAFCTLLLADLGADVLKVERPGAGDGMRGVMAPGGFDASHVALNRGKRSLVLDLRAPDAGTVLKKLVRWADVVVESHKPGQLDALGLGYDVMRGENPRVVWCSVTGFGDFGPHTDAPGHDITFLGASGLLSRLTDGAPTPPTTSVAIPLTGLMSAVGILAALAEAQRTGTGARLDANMTDTAMWTLSEDVALVASGAPAVGWRRFVARGVYECSDGRNVTVSSNEPRTWAVFCEGIGAPDLAGHRFGVDDDDAAIARVAERLGTRPAAVWLASPGLAGGIGPVNELTDLVDDPQVVERGSLVRLPGSGRTVLANPIRFASATGAAASHGSTDAPALGAHTDDALRAAGFDDAEIVAFHTAKVVG